MTNILKWLMECCVQGKISFIIQWKKNTNFRLFFSLSIEWNFYRKGTVSTETRDMNFTRDLCGIGKIVRVIHTQRPKYREKFRQSKTCCLCWKPIVVWTQFAQSKFPDGFFLRLCVYIIYWLFSKKTLLFFVCVAGAPTDNDILFVHYTISTIIWFISIKAGFFSVLFLFCSVHFFSFSLSFSRRSFRTSSVRFFDSNGILSAHNVWLSEDD